MKFLLRWLAGLKNSMNWMNSSRRRSNSGDLPAGSGTAEEELGGGAEVRSEKGGEWEIRVDGEIFIGRGRRFVLRILWSECKRRAVGWLTRVVNPKR